MNIRAVMATLEVSDLDRAAKHALLVVSCRAARETGVVAVSARRVAKDMRVSRPTAQAALNRLVTAGYLAVDKRPGMVSIWRLTCKVDESDLSNPDPLPVKPGFTRRSKKEKDKEVGANGAGVENPQPGWSPDLPPNPWVVDENSGYVVNVSYVRGS